MLKISSFLLNDWAFLKNLFRVYEQLFWAAGFFFYSQTLCSHTELIAVMSKFWADCITNLSQCKIYQNKKVIFTAH